MAKKSRNGGPGPETFPTLPKARVTSQIGLNVRSGPGISNPLVGYLPSGTEVEVIRKLYRATIPGYRSATSNSSP